MLRDTAPAYCIRSRRIHDAETRCLHRLRPTDRQTVLSAETGSACRRTAERNQTVPAAAMTVRPLSEKLCTWTSGLQRNVRSQFLRSRCSALRTAQGPLRNRPRASCTVSKARLLAHRKTGHDSQPVQTSAFLVQLPHTPMIPTALILPTVSEEQAETVLGSPSGDGHG